MRKSQLIFFVYQNPYHLTYIKLPIQHSKKSAELNFCYTEIPMSKPIKHNHRKIYRQRVKCIFLAHVMD